MSDLAALKAALADEGTPRRRMPPSVGEGDNYGYASHSPLSADPAALQRRGQMLKAIGGLGIGLGAVGAGIHALEDGPLSALAGGLTAGAGYGIYDHGRTDFARGRNQMRGTHPDQMQMDADLQAMRYYGHGSMRGPR
jgi:hypothetical protein